MCDAAPSGRNTRGSRCSFLTSSPGAELPLSEVRQRIAAAEGLTAEDLREMLPSGRQSALANRVNWAVIYMERAGLLERVRRGVYRSTQEGELLLSRMPSRIDVNLLGEYPEFIEWSRRANAPSSSKDTTEKQRNEGAETPEEALERAAGQLSSALEADVLHRVRHAAPAFLEGVVVDLLITILPLITSVLSPIRGRLHPFLPVLFLLSPCASRPWLETERLG